MKDFTVGASLPEVSLVSVTSPGSYYTVLNATVKVSHVDPSDDPSTILVMHYGVGHRSIAGSAPAIAQNALGSSNLTSHSNWEFISNVVMNRVGDDSYSCEISLPVLSRGHDEILNELDFVFLRINSEGSSWIKGSETPLGYYVADFGAIIAAAIQGKPYYQEALRFPVLPIDS
jgi:hypothetical protein